MKLPDYQTKEEIKYEIKKIYWYCRVLFLTVSRLNNWVSLAHEMCFTACL